MRQNLQKSAYITNANNDIFSILSNKIIGENTLANVIQTLKITALLNIVL